MEYDGLQLPTKPQSKGAAGGVSQKDRRFTDTFFDIHKHATRFPHGRPWTGEREFAANADQGHEPGFITTDLQKGQYVTDETGTMQDRLATIRSTWFAPWEPMAKYWRFNYKRKLITFDYALMRVQEEEGRLKYFRAAAKLGIQLNLRVEMGVLPHPQIVLELGEPSQMSTIAQAAIAGDPWLLGFIDEPNEQLSDILGINALGMPSPTYIPPERQQAKVDAVLAAPMSQDLMEMLSKIAAAAASAAVSEAFAKRDEDAQAKIRQARQQAVDAA